jgi:cell fate regulator YaaT (PSP1 superfamily)
MRQVGIRNQAKMCGGMGRCGRVFCCSSFMEKFEPVSIRMAKQQGLSLNPTKISGQCGRLMCCLTFENETYRKLKQGIPQNRKNRDHQERRGKVTRHNVICNRLTVRLKKAVKSEISLDDIVKDRR